MSDNSKTETYIPSKNEAFMSDRQRAFFKKKLENWKEEILQGSKDTINNLQEANVSLPDVVDRASAESDHQLELRTRDRQRKLISKINAAILRIDEGTYGYCDETGEPISLKRLQARPTATLSVEAQERHEQRERTVRND